MDKLPLTADLVARAVVASARAYGDDPVRCFMAQGGPCRRSMSPAAEALSRATRIPYLRLAPLLGIAPRGSARARANGGAAYERAFAAAEAAVLGAVPPTLPPPTTPVQTAPPVAGLGSVTPGPRRAPAGALTSWYTPMIGAPSSLPIGERPLADRIVEVLHDGSATSMGLASILGAKESLVGQSLSALAHVGVVEAGEIPEEGVRHQRWSLAQRAAA